MGGAGPPGRSRPLFRPERNGSCARSALGGEAELAFLMESVFRACRACVYTRRMADTLEHRVSEARQRLNAHTREIVAWHFDPATGCPFWLDYAKNLKWDPRKEIQSYADLDK